MKSSVWVSFILIFGLIGLVLGPVGLAAQSTLNKQASYGVASMEAIGTGSANTVTTVQAPVIPICPVSLRAQHAASGGMLQAGQNHGEVQARPKGMAQLLHLTLLDHFADAKPMVSARVRVRGLSGKGRVTQTLAGENDHGQVDADFVRTLEVRFSPAAERQVSGDLRVPGMTAVLSLELTSVTYADGETRSFSGRDVCRVTPDPLMYVSGH